MKKLLMWLMLIPALAMGADAANDLVLSQRKADNSGFIQRNVPVQNAITSASLPSFQSAIGIGVADVLYLKGWKSVPNTTTYAASTDINLTKNLQTVSLTGNVTFTTSAKAAGLYTTVRVVADGTNRTLTFPGTWVWVGSTAPAQIIASKVGLLSLVCFGATDADVVASWVTSL